MNKPQRMQKRWSWIMGGITLVVSLFLPHFWRLPPRVEGYFWQLLDLSPASSLKQVILRIGFSDLLILFFPPSALTACTIWFWNRQMHWRPTHTHGILVIMEATGLALLAAAAFSVVVFIIPAPGNGWGMAFAIFNTMWAGVAFLAFLPCLLIAATILACLQRKYQVAKDGIKSGL